MKVIASVESTIEYISAKPHAHPAVLAMLRQAPHLLSENEERIKHDYVERTEYSRVQRLLGTTQQFLAKAKRQARAQTAAAA